MAVAALTKAAAGAAAVLVVAGCGAADGPVRAATTAPADDSTAPSRSAARLIGPDEFATAVAGIDTVTINVHVPFEGDIAGTDVWIPFDQVESQTAQLPQRRNTPLAVYCRTGRMSAVAVGTLSRLGYTDIVELAGGMQAWESAGRPLVGR